LLHNTALLRRWADPFDLDAVDLTGEDGDVVPIVLNDLESENFRFKHIKEPGA
jgi:hypothetical protein